LGSFQSAQELLAKHRAAIVRLYEACPAAPAWGFSLEQFGDAVFQSLQRWKPDPASTPVETYLESLHGADLAIAAACRLGLERAWNDFVAAYRPVLYSAARAIARDEIRGRELADSLYADLYGMEMRQGARRSLLQYFDGRSSLATWLRAVLARRYIDAYRQERRVASIEELAPSSWSEAADPADPPDPDRARSLELLRQALDAAAGALAARDRLRLSYYYLQELTLKQIGHLLGEHESTVSRRLNRSRKALRRQVERELRRKGLNREQIALCYDYAAREWPYDLAQALGESK
jgi:RNA polymerase sigma-70 factor (ECF subfamily)